jgi:hypothetical protein
MDMTNTPVIAAVVDRLAALKAEIARLKSEEESLKQSLIDTGMPVMEGTLHRVAISRCDGRITTDWKAVAEYFTPSRQLLAAHTTQGEDFFTVRVSARKS